ncbi:hypothetical protein AYO43_01810 [Nitrospira sp. SCGC AG-212-E16]|nr:hypothetical protein AYO43_01810 [Nitrospira sp. SCGC AG-212-E16]
MQTAVTAPTIRVPNNGDTVSFNDPILIQWDWNPNDIPVTKFHICIGTEEGNWNLVNGEVGLADRFSFILPPLYATANQIHIQLLYKTIITHPDPEEETFLVARVTVNRA